jgi:hypothetical protein
MYTIENPRIKSRELRSSAAEMRRLPAVSSFIPAEPDSIET